MPAVILQLEDEVDAVAGTERWTKGEEGLVAALREEKFPFATYDAQRILESAAVGGKTMTVRELLAAGVPIQPLPAPKRDNPNGAPFEEVQLLTAASAHPDILKAFLDLGVSKGDQKDKDLALDFAAQAGKLGAVRALIAYGANPIVALGNVRIATNDRNVMLGQEGPGSVLIDAARSGNPEVVKEILRYSPSLEIRDRKGKTALFVAGESTRSDEDEERVTCVRLLAEAGARVDARDSDGNTLLHTSDLLDVSEELLKLGADVNARNNQGETPIFTNMEVRVLPLFLRYGADLTVRDNRGETVLGSRWGRGPAWDEALQRASTNTGHPQ